MNELDIAKIQFFRSIILELMKAAITFIFGYISFKLFQRYKNKKDNNKLYIKIIKLEKELNQNKDNVEKILNEYIEKEILEEQFYINREYSEELYKLYCDITQLELTYYVEEPVYEMGEQVGVEYVYSDRPYQIIDNIQYGISSIENDNDCDYDEIKSLEEQLSYYENKNIYDEFAELENRLCNFLHQNSKLHESIKFLYSKVKKYNELSKQEKSKYLNKFCILIFEKENQFTVSLENFKILKKLTDKLDNTNKKSKLKLNFNLWETIDIDLLAVYSAETYLILEELYLKLNNLEIIINNGESVKEAYNILINKLEPIIVKERDKLKKTLLRTNRLFSGI
ncbi:hypothetical protein FDA95_12650 [Clostridium botulinum]|nr:hypothetical protein [Clostridium botulinum]